MINIFDSKCVNFNNNGLVVLGDCISALVPEELNGLFELELEYMLDVKGKWKYLLEGNIIKADGQLFRIYHKFKNLTSIKINARHIFYDLLDNFLEDVRPTGLSGEGALDWVLTHTQYSHRFTSMGDVGGSNTQYYVRKNPIEAIMGQDGIINTWGGELVRDNFTIKLLGQRGLDRGVLVAYGKNIQGIEETLDMDGICTRLMPVGKDALLLTEKYIDSQYINNFSHPKIKIKEFTDIEDQVTLRAAATKYILDNKIDIPQFNYKIDFLELSKTEEYKNYAILQTVYMGDTVTIKHNKLNINLKAKVIKITKNILTKRIEKIELGSFKPNLATTIGSSIQEVKTDIANTKSSLQLAIDNATTQINSALGGYVIKRNGELLIMDTEDPLTAVKVWRWNVNGLGYSGTGYNGPFRTAMTADGHIVADFIDAGTLNAGIIKVGILRGIKIQEVSDTGVLLADLYKNANGGLMQIFDINGNLNAKIGSENGTGANRGGTMILYDDNLYLPRVELGISSTYGAGIMDLKDYTGIARVIANAQSNLGPILAVLNSSQLAVSYLTETVGKIAGNTIVHEGNFDAYLNYGLSGYATQSYVDGQIAAFWNACVNTFVAK